MRQIPAAHRWNDEGSPRLGFESEFEILVNGEPLPNKGITAYNCEEGWVERLTYDADGKIAFSMDLEHETYELHTETLRGTVTTRWKTISK